MTRKEFMDALRSRLNRLPAEELESALDYYNEIFLDAGEENEAETAEKLGSIDDIARQIYIENGIDPDGRPTFMMDEYIDPSSENYSREQPYQAPAISTGISPAVLIAVILLLPVWFPILVVCFVLTFVFFILGIVLEIVFVSVGGALLVNGFITVFKVPPIGLMSIGCGLFLIGLFVLTFKGAFTGAFKAFRGVINGFVGLAHRIFVGGAVNG